MTYRTMLGAGLVLAMRIFGQTPAFDVASVRLDNGAFVPGVSGRIGGGPGTSDPGRFTCKQDPLKFIVAFAFDILPDQLSGPAWLDDIAGDRFTITATMPPDTTKERFQLMLQNLLAERFHLTAHHETRDFPGYDLIVAPGGPKLTPWTPDLNANAVPGGATGPDEQGFPRLRPGQPGGATSFAFGGGGMVRSTQRQSMAGFAKRLSSLVNKANGMPSGSAASRVSDKTGLTGIYEFRLEFEAMAPTLGTPSVDALDPGAGGLTLFTALEKQLGLKLVKVKGVPVDTVVIDHLDKVPAEN